MLILNVKKRKQNFRCDGLQVGDRLISVNGIRVRQLRHQDLLTLLRNAGETVMLELAYDLEEIRKKIGGNRLKWKEK